MAFVQCNMVIDTALIPRMELIVRHGRPDACGLKLFRLEKAMTLTSSMAISIAGVMIPDSKLAREITELVTETESPLLFHHSSRVYYWGALAGQRRGLKVDADLLYAGAMFHDMGLTAQHSSTNERFE